MKSCLIWLLLMILGIANIYCIGFTIYSYVYADPIIETYITDTAVLLDSIEERDESFQDTWGETDYYNNYLYSKEKVDNLYNE